MATTLWCAGDIRRLQTAWLHLAAGGRVSHCGQLHWVWIYLTRATIADQQYRTRLTEHRNEQAHYPCVANRIVHLVSGLSLMIVFHELPIFT